MPRKSRERKMLELLSDFGIILAILALIASLGMAISVTVRTPILTLADVWDHRDYAKVHVYHLVNGSEVEDVYRLEDIASYANGTLSIASPAENTTKIVLELQWLSWSALADRGINSVNITVEPAAEIEFGPFTGNGTISKTTNPVEFSVWANTHPGTVKLEVHNASAVDIARLEVMGVGKQPLLAVLTQPFWAVGGMIMGYITAIAAGIRRQLGYVMGAMSGAIGAFVGAIAENPIAAIMGMAVVLFVFYMIAKEQPRRR
ncbi:hypothetical protein Pyrde_1897 [Pyrodictium delaneyi]|uniref:Uncharacterized protein n=1 Tax=Pyrodictium delaneyi TaxID=1273541 RepID=A0A0P0N4V6_9CREN|nr:hypothetical protein [Pyrodictium delaneyi]ALL01940.1 hypothetical protein Pyrde_1897 [Pyrodictium delaneyi]